MRKIFLILLCFILIAQASAAEFEITDDYAVEFDKNALLSTLFEADISSLRQAIDLRLISCRELTQYYLERIEAYNDTFHCFITLCDNALEVAQERDAAIEDGTAEGLLFGIPVVVKDNIAYEGYPTTNGLSYYNPPISEDNATVVQRLLDEGAVILGKTNMSAAAQDAICSINSAGMQTFNAYDPNLSSGGSSGGSAAAVSLNFAAAGLGTDTNASLRYPAALNGCVSLRTTFGLVDNEGCIILNKSRDIVGAITRSVYDQAVMLDVLSEGSYTKNLNANALNGTRIGVFSEFSYPVQPTGYRSEQMLDDDIQAAFDRSVEELKQCGAEIVTVSLPSIFSDVSNANAENLYEKLKTLMRENKISALIYPTYQHTPHYTSNEYLRGKSIYELLYICNCATFSPITGAPELSIPIGHHSNGAGIGMEILALKNPEQLLLDIAYAYTEKFDHRRASEVAPNLYENDSQLSLEDFLKQYKQAFDEAEAQRAADETANEPTTEEQTSTAPTEAPPPQKVSSRARSPWLFVAIGLSVVATLAGMYFISEKMYIFK